MRNYAWRCACQGGPSCSHPVWAWGVCPLPLLPACPPPRFSKNCHFLLALPPLRRWSWDVQGLKIITVPITTQAMQRAECGPNPKRCSHTLSPGTYELVAERIFADVMQLRGLGRDKPCSSGWALRLRTRVPTGGHNEEGAV